MSRNEQGGNQMDGYKECTSCHRWLSQGEGGDPPMDENDICDDCNDPFSDSKMEGA